MSELKNGDEIRLLCHVDRVKEDGTVLVLVTGKWQDQFVLVDKSAILAAQPSEAATVSGETSDGYHTFNELYEHRHALFSRIAGWKSRLHHDGTMFDGWFIAGVQTPLGQATYHLPLSWWDRFNVQEFERAPEWDGHTAHQVPERICSLFAQPLTPNAGEVRRQALEEACEQLERDCGRAIDELSDKLPEGAVKQEARTRLGLWKSNIRALAASTPAGPQVLSAEYHRGAKEAFQRVVDEWNRMGHAFTIGRVQSWANNCAVYEQQHRLEAAGAAKEAPTGRETELREALKRYGDHEAGCDYFIGEKEEICSCGLGQWLAPDKPQPPREQPRTCQEERD